jgi:dTMP kinase
MNSKKGKFITLEGGEGVGKTTNIPFIKEYLKKQAIEVVVTREPGGTQLAEKIRALLLQNNNEESVSDHAEILLIFAARAQHINHVINPALVAGNWVLCDRFTDATYAYQGGGRGMSRDAIAWLEDFVQGYLRPDLTLLLDMPVDAGMYRAKNRGGVIDRFESEHLQFFNQVRQIYLQQAQQYPDRIKIIKADQPLDSVQKDIIEELKHLLV